MAELIPCVNQTRRGQNKTPQSYKTKKYDTFNSSFMTPPTKQEIKKARLDAGLTQTQAAALIYLSCRAWQQYESGNRQMYPAFWELFLIKKSEEPKWDIIILNLHML